MLLDQLRNGMSDLEFLKEKKNPNFENQAVANLNQLRQAHMLQPVHTSGGQAPAPPMNDSFTQQRVLQGMDNADGINYDTQSIQSQIMYNQSAIGEMNFDELNQLMTKNAKRIKQIEQHYLEEQGKNLSYKDVRKMELETFKTSERYRDDSTSYPCYGHGLTPNMNMNTFMVQEAMTAVLKNPPVAAPVADD